MCLFCVLLFVRPFYLVGGGGGGGGGDLELRVWVLGGGFRV